ncbi:MAG: recombinase family protein [Bacteroidetes bacterium]|nr:recombinase family protein [Bacteroidota bacterium]
MILQLIRTRSGEDYNHHAEAVKYFAKKKRLQIEGEIKQDLSANPKYISLNNEVAKKLNAKDILVIPEISALGPSFSTVIDVITKLLKKNVEILSAKEPLILHPRMLNSQTFLDALVISKTIEQFIVTQRAGRGLLKRKNSGIPLGRPKGRKSRITKLSGKEEIIREYLEDGIGYSGIGRRLDVDRLTVKSFIKLKKIKARKK